MYGLIDSLVCCLFVWFDGCRIRNGWIVDGSTGWLTDRFVCWMQDKEWMDSRRINWLAN